MMLQLKNEIFALNLDLDSGTFDILTNNADLPNLRKIYLSATYLCAGSKWISLENGWQVKETTLEKINTAEHGEIEMVTLLTQADNDGIAYKLQFGIVQEYPLLIWKVEMLNQGVRPINIDAIDLLRLDPKRGGSVDWAKAVSQKELGFFTNGWQSWSAAQWYPADGRMHNSRLGGLQEPMILNHGTPKCKKNGEFSSDFFAVLGDRTARSGFVLGFLSQKAHFGSIFADFNRSLQLRLWANGDSARLDPGSSMTTDWAVFNPVLLDHRDPLDKYLEAVARENKVKVPAESPVGWCSWYHFYTNLSARDIEANLTSIVNGQERLPIQLVQIDDGFETQVGDWFTFKPTFPQGVSPLAEKISKEGLIPGLWLAPFIVHTKSELIRNHPDWILRKANGRPVNAGYVWGVLGTGLDLTVPEALEYACSVVRTAAQDWGFPYLKLDFLYAAALDGKFHDPTQTRAQVLRKGMEALREAVGPDVTLLGCGAPLGSMLGLVEAMRIGPDVSGDWQPVFNGIKAFIKNEPSYPCARNSIRNILTRANLHGHWWVNDPDCLLIRPDTHLSLEEVKTLATAIGMTGGSLLLSDDLPKLPPERIHLAEVLLPVLGERAQVLDWFDAEMPALLRVDLLNDTGEWYLTARFNWQERPADLSLSPLDFRLPAGDYWLNDFWQGKTTRLTNGESYLVKDVPAHGCVLASFRRVQLAPQYLGSNLHYSMGKEVAEWHADSDELEFTLRLPRTTEGKVKIVLPWQKVAITCEKAPVAFAQTENGVCEFPVAINGFARIKVRKA